MVDSRTISSIYKSATRFSRLVPWPINHMLFRTLSPSICFPQCTSTISPWTACSLAPSPLPTMLSGLLSMEGFRTGKTDSTELIFWVGHQETLWSHFTVLVRMVRERSGNIIVRKNFVLEIWSHRFKKRSELGIQLGTSKQGKGEGREGSWY